MASPLLLDAFTCVLRRYIAKQPIFSPHKVHLYQRLHQAGMSHAFVSTLYIISTFICSLLYFLFDVNGLFLSLIYVIVAGLTLEKYFAIPFNIAILRKL
ncbi:MULTISPECIES: hypothetical protein [unclassified Prochlorococcus]|uniref:hypothetical protein n=1 Tax=unclassified Prochlorococcus TaxID=2627481 RepID=UPI001F4CD914|nr:MULTISPECIES: hypothetical protein [unclassified Prochlorococcus]